MNDEYPELDEITEPEGLSFGVIGFARNTETAATLYGLGVIGAGDDATMTSNGALIAGAGNNLRFSGTAGLVGAGNNVTLQNARIGILADGSGVTAGDNVHVIMRAPRAVAFGATFGAAFALLTWLLRRR